MCIDMHTQKKSTYEVWHQQTILCSTHSLSCAWVRRYRKIRGCTSSCKKIHFHIHPIFYIFFVSLQMLTPANPLRKNNLMDASIIQEKKVIKLELSGKILTNENIIQSIISLSFFPSLIC